MAIAKMPSDNQYPDNSDAAKAPVPVREEEEHTEEPVGAVIRKKSTGRRMAEAIIPKSDRREIGNHLVYDILFPALKETASELVNNAVNMFLFGDTRTSDRRVKSGKYHDTYNSKYSGGRSSSSNRERYRRRSINLDDIIFPNRGKALRAYDELLDILDEYHWVKVKDLFNTAELTSDWTGDAYGWDDLPPKAEIERVKYRDDDGDIVYGYSLILPSPIRER